MYDVRRFKMYSIPAGILHPSQLLRKASEKSNSLTSELILGTHDVRRSMYDVRCLKIPRNPIGLLDILQPVQLVACPAAIFPAGVTHRLLD